MLILVNPVSILAEVGWNRARNEDRDSESVRGKFSCDRFGEPYDPRLTRAIGRMTFMRDQTGQGSGVDDVLFSVLLAHAGQENIKAMDHTPEVDAEDQLPVIEGSVQDAAIGPPGDSGIIA